MKEAKIKGIILGTVIGMGVLITGLFSFTTVPAGNTGIKVRLGAVQESSLKEGLNFKIPFVEKIVLMDNRTQIVTAEGNSASKDLQTVENTIAVNFRVNPEKSAYLYQKVGVGYVDTIMSPAIQEATKGTIAKYTAEELITKRAEVGEGIKEELSNKVSDYGIVVENLNIVNFNFSEEFNAAIEAKQTATQQALKAQEDLSRIEIEAKQKVVEAQGEAEANRILSESISDQLLQREFINKWDGKLPTVMGSEGNIMDITSLMENSGQ